MKCTKLFMMAGTAKMRKYIPIHDLCEKLTPATKANILAYHAVLGCDVTSQLHGLSKVKCWKNFEENSDLLSSLGKVPLTPDAVTSVEKFVVKLFNLPKTCQKLETRDDARYALFGKSQKLPPTSSALEQHILRAHFQTAVWEMAHLADMILPNPEESGWQLSKEGDLVPVLTTREAVPKACIEVITCECTTGCGKNTEVHTNLCMQGRLFELLCQGCDS